MTTAPRTGRLAKMANLLWAILAFALVTGGGPRTPRRGAGLFRRHRRPRGFERRLGPGRSLRTELRPRGAELSHGSPSAAHSRRTSRSRTRRPLAAGWSNLGVPLERAAGAGVQRQFPQRVGRGCGERPLPQPRGRRRDAGRPRRDSPRWNRLYAPPLGGRARPLSPRRRAAGRRVGRAVRLSRLRAHLCDCRSAGSMDCGRGSRSALGGPAGSGRSGRCTAECLYNRQRGFERCEKLPGQPGPRRICPAE